MTSLTLCQRNSVLRTCGDAQSARSARVRVRRVRDIESMHTQLESVHHAEAAIVLLDDAPQLEHTFRTNPFTIALAFAAFQIDYRMD